MEKETAYWPHISCKRTFLICKQDLWCKMTPCLQLFSRLIRALGGTIWVWFSIKLGSRAARQISKLDVETLASSCSLGIRCRWSRSLCALPFEGIERSHIDVPVNEHLGVQTSYCREDLIEQSCSSPLSHLKLTLLAEYPPEMFSVRLIDNEHNRVLRGLVLYLEESN